MRLLFTALAAIACLVPAANGASLVLEQVELAENAVVQFSEIYCAEIELSDELTARSPHWRCSDTESFRVCSDSTEIQPSRYSGFSYVLYVRPRTESGLAGICECRLSSTPIGAFLDQEGTVDFTVTMGETAETGSIRLPLHSTQSEHFLTFALAETPQRIRIGQAQTLWIGLRSRLKDLDVVLRQELDTKVGDPSVWENGHVRASLATLAGATASEFRIQPGPHPVRAVALEVRSLRRKALGAAFFPYRAERGTQGLDSTEVTHRRGIHDRIIVYVPYQTDGGMVRILEIEIPVRFQPSPWLLISLVVSGAFLARGLLYLQRRVSFGSWLRGTLVGAGVALLGWLLGLLLVEANSELRLLGLVFDPYQLVPAFLIGVILGLTRPRLVRKLEELAGASSGKNG